ncbi:MAG: hypothetical protein HS113_20460 [Verrucomicrobiales bacterium]|nr:hypothetical protein [Verrucomicrobiales bacterium]
MKTRLIIGLCVVGCVGGYGQGRIDFDTYSPGSPVNAPVFRPDGTGAGAGFTAGLFLVQSGGSLEPLFPTTVFKTFSPATAPYVLETTLIVPGHGLGATVTVRMRAWETAAGSYEAAVIRGESNDIPMRLHDLNPVPLMGLQGFTMVPESPAGALGLLGAAAFWLAARARPSPGSTVGSPNKLKSSGRH